MQFHWGFVNAFPCRKKWNSYINDIIYSKLSYNICHIASNMWVTYIFLQTQSFYVEVSGTLRKKTIYGLHQMTNLTKCVLRQCMELDWYIASGMQFLAHLYFNKWYSFHIHMAQLQFCNLTNIFHFASIYRTTQHLVWLLPQTIHMTTI